MKQKDTCLDVSNILKKDDKSDIPIQIFHNLMPFKVREILLVSSLYDAFIVEEEGLISELVIGEYRHLLLSSPPRVTHVTSGEEALNKIKHQKYDVILTMSKNIGMDSFDFGRKVKKICKDIPIAILATDTADLILCQQRTNESVIDKAFFWYGNTTLFMGIVKYIEDKINAPYDTSNANVQVIILVEDSIRDYSIFIPIIYSEIVQQTQRSISDDLNELQRLLRRRARPKILLAETFEEAIKMYKKYKYNILGIISDAEFKRSGKADPKAGYDFINFVKKDNPYIPTLLQSSNPLNKKNAKDLGTYFIDKNSPTLIKDFNHFLLKHLGFGDFVFLLPKNKTKLNIQSLDIHKETIEIAKASNLKEFESFLQKIPLESIKFHSNRNDFSKWLRARCEFKLARKLQPQKVTDFSTLNEMRRYLINVFNESRREKQLGVMTDFSLQKFEFDSSYTRIGKDSLGGKGRGIAFIRTLLTRYNFEERYKNVKIVVPSTVAIGTDEFDRFISENNLYNIKKQKNIDDGEIVKEFLKGRLSEDLKIKLRVVLNNFKKPIAVRSSSLLEDSQNHPFAGIYSTYMLPNNHRDIEIRLKHLCEAIKLIYASIFFKNAKAYIKATAAKIEEEKMAIIIQELIGNEYKGNFYPTFSGVAQSYNYYPISYQKREEGIVSIAAGLGYSVVGGEKVLRFSPRFPEIIPDFSSPEMIMENTQRELYVLNTNKKIFIPYMRDGGTLKKINISDIANDGSLEYISSTFDRNDGMIRDTFSEKGPYLITFAGILKYNVFPLSDILKNILDAGQKSMGCPIEIEFAVNFPDDKNKPPTLAIIQIRPLVISNEHYHITWDNKDIKEKHVLIYSEKALGNGIIDDIKDIVFVPPETFDPARTLEISEEIEKINKNLIESNNSYLLIGPGRWGTQDRWLGIPVSWNQISNVKVMVEMSLKDYNIKPTQGTHFFQNIISRGIGYIHTTVNPRESFIDFKWLDNVKSKYILRYVRHIKLEYPLIIKLDGRNGKALVTRDNTNHLIDL